MIRTLVLLFAAVLVAGCVGPPPSVKEQTDSGPRDAGSADAEQVGSGADAAGPVDAGRLDAGVPDVGTTDAGTIDAGRFDQGSPDVGTADAEFGPDTGTDAGHENISDLILHLDCEAEVAGAIPDISGANNDAFCRPGGRCPDIVAAPDPSFGNACAFDGTNTGMFVLSSPEFEPTRGLTIAVWVDFQPALTRGLLFSRGYQMAQAFEILLLQAGNLPSVGFVVQGNSVPLGDSFRTRDDITPGFKQVVIVWNPATGSPPNGTFDLYVDGTAVRTGERYAMEIEPNPLFIGFDGRAPTLDAVVTIDEVRVFSRALDAVEVDNL